MDFRGNFIIAIVVISLCFSEHITNETEYEDEDYSDEANESQSKQEQSEDNIDFNCGFFNCKCTTSPATINCNNKKFSNLSQLTRNQDGQDQFEKNLTKQLLYAAKVNLKHLSNNQLFNAAINTVNFSHNALEELKNETFMDMLLLETLDLSSNQIKLIENDTFTPIAKHLTNLYLDHNKLVHLYNLSELYSLKNLTLSNNMLTQLPMFPGQLTRLDLSWNNLSSLTSVTFQGLILLEKLDMSSNNISFFDSDVFSHMTNLVELNLNTNYIKRIASQSVLTLAKLKVLEMRAQKCEILVIEDYAFDRNENVTDYESIDLNNNTFVKLNAKSFCSRKSSIQKVLNYKVLERDVVSQNCTHEVLSKNEDSKAILENEAGRFFPLCKSLLLMQTLIFFCNFC